MVSSQDWTIPGQVVKVIHDDGDKEIEHEEGAEEDEGNKVGVGEGGAADFGLVFARRLVEGECPGVAGPTLLAREHDTGPGFTRRTSVAAGRRKIGTL